MKIDKTELLQIVEPNSKVKWITSYKDGDDIKEYHATKIAYLPLNIDAKSIYRDITDEEHIEYTRLKEEATLKYSTEQSI